MTATALIGTGLARRSRQKRVGDACILTFHGVCASGEDAGLLDASLHTPQKFFHELCAHLAKNYRVLPLDVISRMLTRNEPLPDRVVALTFDDGYESNYRLAYPALREFELPATIFLCTGFIDGTVQPWFTQLEVAMARATVRQIEIQIGAVPLRFSTATQTERATALPTVLRAFKQLPQSAVAENLNRLVKALQPVLDGNIPAPLRPMNWKQARELRDSGLINFGAHTHTHPILGRCTTEVARHEIFHSRDRISTELGAAPALFAYPNGHAYDYNADTKHLLQEAGFRAAFTMIPGRALPDTDPCELPRYGSPESLQQAEATVSGAFETFKAWRQRMRRAFSPSM
ncbi:MAG: polysaccharide deacetylase family protein [Verrucomicrobia bacterium]|nr:polysaccharide deacetylase family protein [Verrucomicrobiota bacterium]